MVQPVKLLFRTRSRNPVSRFPAGDGTFRDGTFRDGTGTRWSVAAAGFHHHVAVLLEDDVVVAVVVEDGSGAELRGGTARLGHGLGLHQVDLGRWMDGWSP